MVSLTTYFKHHHIAIITLTENKQIFLFENMYVDTDKSLNSEHLSKCVYYKEISLYIKIIVCNIMDSIIMLTNYLIVKCDS